MPTSSSSSLCRYINDECEVMLYNKVKIATTRHTRTFDRSRIINTILPVALMGYALPSTNNATNTKSVYASQNGERAESIRSKLNEKQNQFQ